MSTSRTWFGFRPVVLVAAASVLAAGGFLLQRGHQDALDRAVATSCADAITFKQTRKPVPGIAPSHDIFGDFLTVAEIRIRALEGVSASPDRAALREQLLASERQIIAEGSQGEALIGPYTERGDFSGAARSGAMHEAMPHVQALITQTKALDAVYEEHFGLAHCAD